MLVVIRVLSKVVSDSEHSNPRSQISSVGQFAISEPRGYV